ncbi:hypothetical protein Tco_1582127, partial [Tanacetum coccineum]
MPMTIQSSVKNKILVAQSETSLAENASVEMLRDLDQQMEKKEDGDVAESIGNTTRYEYGLSSSNEWTKQAYHSDFGRYAESMSPVLWDEIGESRLIRPELVQETIDKVVLIKERLKAPRERQKSYADNMLRFGKKRKLAP